MSWLMSAIYDGFMRKSEEACLRAWRKELLADLGGDVLEIGAGTGANLPYYPTSVRRLVLVEPDPFMARRLEARPERNARPEVEIVHASGDELPFTARSFDWVVCTLVLCSVPDVSKTLLEIRRVLRPDGRLVFLEHVAADGTPTRLAWQRRIEPFWKPLAGNCHLTRRADEALRDAGFIVEIAKRESMRKALPFLRPTVRGVARTA
jgi:ubiquinone/menaquinone biosynthesis C-methylase UbiE